MTRVAIAGIGGRMGHSVASLIHADPALVLMGGVIRHGSPLTVDSVREAIGDAAWPGRLVDDPGEILSEVDVLVDFTNPESTVPLALACQSAGKAFVSGTTGLTDADYAQLRQISAQIPVFYAANLSIGVSTILDHLPEFVRALREYDIEIIETHHRGKADAPSGTALRMVEAIREGQSGDDGKLVYGREGFGPRQPGEIGIHAIRAGGNTGEHTIIFGSENEQVELTHRSYSRIVYARGAVRAIKLVVNHSRGYFTTSDLIG